MNAGSTIFPPVPSSAFREPSVALVEPLSERVAEVDEFGACSIEPLAEFDDSVRSVEADVRQLSLHLPECRLFEIAKRDTGDCADPQKRAESERQRAKLDEQTLRLAARLHARGKPVYRKRGEDGKQEFVMWVQGLHSGAVEVPTTVGLARTMILPAQAAAVRRPILQAAEFFTQDEPLARTGVLTTGPRTRLREVGKRLSELNRAISKLSFEMRRKWGVSIVFRGVELGTPEYDEAGRDRIDAGEIERDPDGEPTFHVHAHIIYHLTRGPMDAERWGQFLVWMSARWGWWWRDCGVLNDVRETVKYIVKPAALDQLTDAELAELFDQLRRKKIVQTTGALRRQIRARRKGPHGLPLRLDRAPTPEGRVWREVECWNKGRKRIAPKTAQERVVSHPGDAYGVADDQRPVCGETFRGKRNEREFDARCVSILPPCFMRGSLVREPCAIFFGRRIDRDAPQRDRRCVMVREATLGEWLAGQWIGSALSFTHAHQLSRFETGENGCECASTGPPDTVGPPESPF